MLYKNYFHAPDIPRKKVVKVKNRISPKCPKGFLKPEIRIYTSIVKKAIEENKPFSWEDIVNDVLFYTCILKNERKAIDIINIAFVSNKILFANVGKTDKTGMIVEDKFVFSPMRIYKRIIAQNWNKYSNMLNANA